MDNQIEQLRKLAEILDEIHSPPFDEYISSLDLRKTVQKKIFLLQELGLHLNYLFKWHAFGPYSEELSEDIREVLLRKKKGVNFEEKSILKDDEQAVMEKFFCLNEEISGIAADPATIYEIASSIQFLESRFPKRFSNKPDRKEAIIENLLFIKPELHDQLNQQKENIFRALEACNLIS